jgi:hypothetical protein
MPKKVMPKRDAPLTKPIDTGDFSDSSDCGTEWKPPVKAAKTAVADDKPTGNTTGNTPSYIDRMVMYVVDANVASKKPVTATTIDTMTEFIREFAKLEYEKKKANGNMMLFGKYKNKSVESIIAFDRQYCSWLISQTMMDSFPELKDVITTALKKK